MTNIRSLVDNIVASNNVSAQEKIADIMAEKLQTLLDLAKIEVAQGMFNTCEDCSQETITQEQYDGLTEEEQADFELIDEALQGNQHKIDANKNGKVDAHDFKLLRKKKGVKEEVEYMDEGNVENKRKKNLAISPFGQTSGTNMKQARADHAASEPKDPYVHPDRSKMGTTALKNAIKRVRRPASYRYKPTLPEEVEQVDEDTFEQGGKTKMDFKTPRHVSPHFKYLKKLSPAEEKADMLKRAGLKDVSKKPPAVKKEEVAHEAYSDPYAAKKSAEMKKAHAATMADAKKEYDAARKPKFAKNFMKMKKEDVNLQELDADTLRSYLGKRSAPPKVAPQDMFRRKQYTPDELRVAKKRQKGKDNAFASIVKKTASPARDAYDNAAAASYNKAKPGTYHGD